MAINFANNSSLANITSLPASISGGGLTLVSSQTASASASLEFSMDSTYDSYVFKFINIHPSNQPSDFQFNFSIDSGSNYNVTKTTTAFSNYHNEADTDTFLGYVTGLDLAQSTAFQTIGNDIGNGNDESTSGILTIYNPSSSVFVKHFLSNFNVYDSGDYTANYVTAGYGNTTSPVTNIKFQMSSGNIDDGIIKMYGVA